MLHSPHTAAMRMLPRPQRIRTRNHYQIGFPKLKDGRHQPSLLHNQQVLRILNLATFLRVSRTLNVSLLLHRKGILHRILRTLSNKPILRTPRPRAILRTLRPRAILRTPRLRATLLCSRILRFLEASPKATPSSQPRGIRLRRLKDTP